MVLAEVLEEVVVEAEEVEALAEELAVEEAEVQDEVLVAVVAEEVD